MTFSTQGKTNWVFILIIVILAVIVGGGILGYQYLWLPKQVPPAESLTELSKDETADRENYKNEKYCSSVSWATYTNNELGFSIKYPKEVLGRYNNLVPVKIIKEDKYKTWVAFDENNLWASGISVTVEPAINREEVESFVEKRFLGECVLDSMAPISIGSAIEKINLVLKEQREGPSPCGAYKLEYYSNLKKIVMLNYNGAPTFMITKSVVCDPGIWDSFTIF